MGGQCHHQRGLISLGRWVVVGLLGGGLQWDDAKNITDAFTTITMPPYIA
jgi:hypothetical protein